MIKAKIPLNFKGGYPVGPDLMRRAPKRNGVLSEKTLLESGRFNIKKILFLALKVEWSTWQEVRAASGG